MRKYIFAVAMTACIPVAVFAQRGGGGGSTAPVTGGGAAAAFPKSPSSHDLADMNPAAYLVDKKKKASLADSTVNQLKVIAKKIEERNKPFYATYDSVRKWTIPLADNGSSRTMKDLSSTAQQQMTAGSSAEQAKMQSSMRDLRGLMGEFKTRRIADVADALAAVPDTQKEAAKALLSQQTDDLDKLISGRP